MRLDYPTARRDGPPTALDQRFDVLESWNLQLGREKLKATPDHAFRLLAPAITLGLALEALFDSGHFFAARVLHRPIYERVGSYHAIEAAPEKLLPIWQARWPSDFKLPKEKRRPSIKELLKTIPRLSVGPEADFIRKYVYESHNAAIHPDPDAYLMLLLQNEDDELAGQKIIVGSQLHDLEANRRAEIENTLVLDCLLDALKDAFPDLDIDEAVA